MYRGLFEMQLNLNAATLALCLLFVIKNSLAAYTNPDNNACTSPNGSPGSCINVRHCPAILEIIEQKPFPRSVIEFLLNVDCGLEGSDPKVCCEFETVSSPPDVTNHENLRLLDYENCGQLSDLDRITHGENASLQEFPWMALLSYSDRETQKFFCGGSIINNRYILTAAHCVTGLPSQVTLVGVRVGEHNLDTETDCEVNESSETICNDEYQEFGIERVTFHPQYSRDSLKNDIAVIRLDRDIDFSRNNVKHICMPIGSAATIPSGKMIVAGWGYTKDEVTSAVLQKVMLVKYPQEDCKNVYRARSTDVWFKQICIGGTSGEDSCKGDSGGPLMSLTIHQSSTRYVQHGVVSFGLMHCGSEGVPGVYTRVDYYLHWILDQLME